MDIDRNYTIRVLQSTRFVYDSDTQAVYGLGMKPLNLPEALKAARKAAGMTQAQVAAKCEWDPPSRYANYEQGIREPTLADLYTIANAVKAGGHSFERIVTGQDLVPASQSVSPTKETIAAAVRLASGAVTGVGLSHFTIETADDAELFALAIEHVQEEDIETASDIDVLRFSRRLLRKAEGQYGKVKADRSDGGANSAKSAAKDGLKTDTQPSRKPRRATGTRR